MINCLVKDRLFNYSVIHYGDLYSAPSRLLLRSALVSLHQASFMTQLQREICICVYLSLMFNVPINYFLRHIVRSVTTHFIEYN